MPQPSKNYGARYSVPVSYEGAALVESERKYQGEQNPGGPTKPLGQLLGEIIVEGCRARLTARGLDPSQFAAVRPSEAADPEPVQKPLTSQDLIEAGNSPEVQSAVNRDGSGRSA